MDEIEVVNTENEQRAERKGIAGKSINLLFKPHLPTTTTFLSELNARPVLLNDAIHLPSFLVDGDQREDARIIADQNRVHVVVVNVPAFAAPDARGGRGGHGRHGLANAKLAAIGL